MMQIELLGILMFILNLFTLQRLQLLTESYLENGEEPFTVDILKEMTSKYPSLIIVKAAYFCDRVFEIYDKHFCFTSFLFVHLGFLSFSDICQKLSADVKQREWLVACCTHKVCMNTVIVIYGVPGYLQCSVNSCLADT